MNRTNPRTNAFITAAGLCALLTLPSISSAEDKPSKGIETLAEESATTAEQHRSLATYFRDKAARARGEATHYRAMPVSFSGRSPGAEAGLRMHYDLLAKEARQKATRYEAMAAMQEEEATKTAK